MKVRQRNSILAQTSPRIKRCEVVGGRAMPASEKSANSSNQGGYKPDEVHVNKQSQCWLSRAQSHNFVLQAKRKLTLSATRQPIMVETLFFMSSLCQTRSSLCLFFVHPTRSHTKEQAGSMPLTQGVAPSPSHNRDSSEKVRTFDKRTHRHKLFDRQRFVSVLWLHHAQLHDLLEV